MELTFKNKLVFFAVQGIYDELPTKFKYHLNQLVTANSDREFVQTVTIDVPTLLKIYSGVANKPKSKLINNEMQDSLEEQLTTLANAGNTEAIEALTEIVKFEETFDATEDAKINSGKEEILNA